MGWTTRVAAALLALAAVASCGGGGDADGRAAAPQPTPAATRAGTAAPEAAGGHGGPRRAAEADRHVRRPGLRHLAARRPGAPVRGRAGRARDGRARRAQARRPVPRHPRAGDRGRRAGPAVARVRARLRRQRPVLRVLHRQRRRPADRRVPAARRRSRRRGLRAAGAADGRLGVQPQRRAAAVRAGRPALRRHRRRRRRRRPARAARQRAEPRLAARQDPAHRSRAPPVGGPTGCRTTTRSPGRSGARGEIYSYGLRNPWRFSFDRAHGRPDDRRRRAERVRGDRLRAARRGPRGELRLAPVRGARALHGRASRRPATCGR